MALAGRRGTTPASADDALPDENAVQIHGVRQPGRAAHDRQQLPRVTPSAAASSSPRPGSTSPSSSTTSSASASQLFAQDLGPQRQLHARTSTGCISTIAGATGSACAPAASSSRSGSTTRPRTSTPRSRSCCCRSRSIPRPIASSCSRRTGSTLYGYLPVGAVGAIEYEAYFGTLYFSLPTRSACEFSRSTCRTSAVASVMWETPVDGLRAGASAFHGKLDVSAQLDGAADADHGRPRRDAVAWLGRVRERRASCSPPSTAARSTPDRVGVAERARDRASTATRSPAIAGVRG